MVGGDGYEPKIGPVDFVQPRLFDIRLRVPILHPKKNRKIRIDKGNPFLRTY